MPVSKQQLDEFGIPIKSSQPEMDEFGIPIKKKVSGSTGPDYFDFQSRLKYGAPSRIPAPAKTSRSIFDEAEKSKQKINSVISTGDDIITGLIRENRLKDFEVQQQNIPQLGGMKNPAAESAKRFILTQSEVTPQEIEEKRQKALSDGLAAKDIIRKAAKKDPSIARSAYILDAQARAEQSPEKEAQIIANADRIEAGELKYNVNTGTLQQPTGAIESVIRGFKERSRQLSDYEALSASKPDQEIIDKLESERAMFDMDKPISIPENATAQFAEMLGMEGIPMVKSVGSAIVTGLLPGGQVLAPYVAAFAASPEYYQRSYESALRSAYNELRSRGKSEAEALAVAKDQAVKEGAIGALEGAVSSALGAKMGMKPTPIPAGTQGAIKRAMLASKEFIKRNAPEAAADAGGAALLQVANNISAIDNGLDRDLMDGVEENVAGELMFSVGIGALTKAGRTALDKNTYRSILNGMSRQPREAVDAKLGEMVSEGSITPEDAVSVARDISKEKSLDSQVPADIPDNARPLITEALEERSKLTQQLASSNEAFHPQIKERISQIDQQIQSYATQESREEQGVVPEGGVVQPERAQEGQPEVGQGAGGIGQAPVAQADAGDRAVSGSGGVAPGRGLFSQPNPAATQIETEFKAQKGINTPEPAPITKLNTERSKAIADAFDAMENRPDDPEVRAAYDAMANETMEQFDAIQKSGVRFEIWEGEGEPYANSQEMIADVRDNNHMYILSTEKDFGQQAITDEQREQNALLRDSGAKDVNGKPLLINDVFRGVHDFFGHTRLGNSFGAIGEENAWNVHARMYSPLARRAMTTETRGQNSWVNFGPQMRNPDGSIKKKGDPGYLGPKERPFGEQKMGLLPEEFSNIEEEYSARPDAAQPAAAQPSAAQPAATQPSEQPAAAQPTTTQPAATMEQELREELGMTPEARGAISRTVAKFVSTATRSLRSFGVKFIVVENDQDAAAQGLTSGQAMFDSGNGVVIINKARLADELDAGIVVWHEASHPIMNAIRNTDRELYDRFVRGMKEAAAMNAGVAGAVKWANDQPQYETQEEKDDEAGVETLGRISAGVVDLNNIPTSFKQALVELINKISKMLGMGSVLSDTSDLAAFKRLATEISKTLTKGADAAGIVGMENVTEFGAEDVQQKAVTLAKGSESMRKYGLPSGRNTTRKIGEALEKRTREKYGTIDRKDRSVEAMKKISSWMAEEVKYFIGEFGENSGKGWYGEKFQKGIDAMAKIFPELSTDQNARDLFTMLVAVTSDGTEVMQNFRQASIAYDQYKKNGRIPETAPSAQRKESYETNFRNIQSLLDEYNGDVQAVKQKLLEISSISDINKERRAQGLEDLNTSWPAEFNVPFAASVFGPKLGMFYANLSGMENYPTLDRWWSRTFNRYRGTLIPRITRGYNKKGKALGIDAYRNVKGLQDASEDEVIASIINDHDSYEEKGYKNGTVAEKSANTLYKKLFIELNDAPFGRGDRKFMYDTFIDTQRRLKSSGIDVTIADIQAILWYFEKNLYKKLGVTKPILGVSYEEAANKTYDKWAKSGESFNYSISEAEEGESIDEIDSAEETEESSVQFSAGNRNLVSDAKLDKFMTEDGEGNYLFFHYSGNRFTKLDPNRFGSNLVTGRGEQPGVGLSMMYTEPGTIESGVPSQFGYAVRVPMEKVYPFNQDPLDLFDEAEAEFRKVYGQQVAFDPNKQVGFITQVAAKKGYPVTVAEWYIGGRKVLRAQTTERLPVEKYKTMDRNVEKVEPKFQGIQSNRRKQKSVGGRNLDKIISDAKAAGTYLKAPNGNWTNLTESQWATVRTLEFKNWFGDWENDPANASKVVDGNGEPMVVYHGSRSSVDFAFSEFNVPPEGVFFSSDYKTASWFSGGASPKLIFEEIKKPEALTEDSSLQDLENYYKEFLDPSAKIERVKMRDGSVYLRFNTEYDSSSSPLGEDIKEAQKRLYNELLSAIDYANNSQKRPFYEAFLNIREPFNINAKGKTFDKTPYKNKEYAAVSVSSDIKAKGKNDGVIIKNTIETTEYNRKSDSYIVFKPNQIKSATENIGTFSTTDPRIQMSVGGRTENDVNFKLAAFVMRKKGEGAGTTELVTSIASVMPGMSPQEIKDLIDDPEGWLKSKYPGMTPEQHSNLIERAKRMNIYRGRKFGAPIDPAFTGLQIPQDKVDEYLRNNKRRDNAAKELFKKYFNKAYFTSSRGLPDWFLQVRDLAAGAKNIEIDRAAKTIERLRRTAKSIEFSDWDAFSEALKDAYETNPIAPAGPGLPAVFTGAGAPPMAGAPTTIPASVSKLPAEIIPFVYAMRGQIDNLTRDLIGFGFVTPEQAINLQSNIGAYVNRSYRLFTEKDYRPSKEVYNAAVKYIADSLVGGIATDKAGAITYEQAMEEAMRLATNKVDAIIQGKTSPYFNPSSIDKRNPGILKQRQEIPEVMRKLLGEYTDPGMVFMLTVSKQAALKASSQYLSELRKMGMGTLFFEENDPNIPLEYNVEIAGEKSETLAPLGGLYTTREIYEALTSMEHTYNNLTQAWMKMVGAVRWVKTVGSVATQAKNFESNLGFAVMNGLLMSGANTEAFKAAGQYVKSQYSMTESNEIADKAIKLNLVGQAIGSRELAEMLGSGDIHDVALDVSLGPEGKWGKRVTKRLNPIRFANKLYRMSDDFWKVYAYINERELVARGRFGGAYDTLTQDQQLQVDAESSERVKNTWPTYDRVIEAAKALSKAAPIFGNFISFQAESLRVLANTIKLAVEDMKDPQMRPAGVRRMVGIATYVSLRTAITVSAAQLFGFAASGLLGAALGDDDEERRKAAIKEALPAFMRTGDLLIKPGSAPHKFTVVNMSDLDPYGIIPRSLNALTEGREGIFGRTMEPGTMAAIAELFSSFAEPEMTFAAMWSVMNNTNIQTGERIVKETDTPGDALANVSSYLWKQLKPSTVGIIERVYKGGSAETEGLALVGARPYEVDLHQAWDFVLNRMRDDMDQVTTQYNRAKYSDKTTAEEKEAARLEAESKTATIVSRYHEVYKNFILTGANPDVLNEKIESRLPVKMTGFTKQVKDGVKTNKIEGDLFKKEEEDEGYKPE